VRRKGHNEEKIVGASRQAEAGQEVSEICFEMGVSQRACDEMKDSQAGAAFSVAKF
jgi:hypothetical protein